MKKNIDEYKSLIRVIEGLIEIFLLSLVYYMCWRHLYDVNDFNPYYGRGKWILAGVYAIILFISFKSTECFRYGYLKLADAFASQTVSIFIVDFITYFELCLIANKMVAVWPMLINLLADIGLCFLFCYVYTVIYHALYVPHDMLLIYGSDNALNLKFKMDARKDRYTITEVINAKAGHDNLIAAINRHDAIILNDIDGQQRNDIVKYSYSHSIRTYLVPRISDLILAGGQDISLFDTPLKLVKGTGLSVTQRFVKRFFDIFLCSVALAILWPIMAIIAIAIKLEDHGPVFYKQKRITRDGQAFDILKFRSMVVDAEKGGYDLSMRATGKDPRITKVGSVIRAIRIDELPQLINIIKGDMSIVGPRPERVENVQAYADEIEEWHLREKVRGGLTGYAQVIGRYNTTPIDKLKLDIMYIENYSLFLDIKIIIMTIRILFSKESTEGFEDNNEQDKIISDIKEKYEYHQEENA